MRNRMKQRMASKPAPKTDSDDDSKENPSNNLIFSVAWGDVLGVIGSITGLVGISAALLWLFGFAHRLGGLRSMNFPRETYPSLPSVSYEQYIYLGIIPFISLIRDIGFGILIYYLTVIFVHIMCKGLFKLIKLPFLSSSLGIIIGIGSILRGLLIL